MEENEKRRNVELAYLSLMLSGKKVSECELASEVLKISRAKGEKSLAMLVQSSIKITVKVLSVVLEECLQSAMSSRSVNLAKIRMRRFEASVLTVDVVRMLCSSGDVI